MLKKVLMEKGCDGRQATRKARDDVEHGRPGGGANVKTELKGWRAEVGRASGAGGGLFSPQAAEVHEQRERYTALRHAG